MRPIQFTWGGYAIADADSIATSQSAAAAADLTLDGALTALIPVYVAQIPPEVTTRVATLSPSGLVTITSAGNDTGITFTTYATAPGQVTITASSFNIDADTTKILTNGKPPLYRRILLSLLGIQWQTR